MYARHRNDGQAAEGRRLVRTTLRIDAEKHALVKEIARRRGVSMADLVRDIIYRELVRMDYLDGDDAKAWGWGS